MSQTLISHILYCIVVPVFVWKYFIIKIYSRTRYNAWNLRLQVKGADLKIYIGCLGIPKLNNYS